MNSWPNVWMVPARRGSPTCIASARVVCGNCYGHVAITGRRNLPDRNKLYGVSTCSLQRAIAKRFYITSISPCAYPGLPLLFLESMKQSARVKEVASPASGQLGTGIGLDANGVARMIQNERLIQEALHKRRGRSPDTPGYLTYSI